MTSPARLPRRARKDVSGSSAEGPSAGARGLRSGIFVCIAMMALAAGTTAQAASGRGSFFVIWGTGNYQVALGELNEQGRAAYAPGTDLHFRYRTFRLFFVTVVKHGGTFSVSGGGADRDLTYAEAAAAWGDGTGQGADSPVPAEYTRWSAGSWILLVVGGLFVIVLVAGKFAPEETEEKLAADGLASPAGGDGGSRSLAGEKPKRAAPPRSVSAPYSSTQPTSVAVPSPSFSCEACGKSYRLRGELVGKKVTCRCGRTFRVEESLELDVDESPHALPNGEDAIATTSVAGHKRKRCPRCDKELGPECVDCEGCGVGNPIGSLASSPERSRAIAAGGATLGESYEALPWYRKGKVQSWLLVASLFVGVFAFPAIFACLTGHVYDRPKKRVIDEIGELKPWSAGNRAAGVVLLLLFGCLQVSALSNLLSSRSSGAPLPEAVAVATSPPAAVVPPPAHEPRETVSLVDTVGGAAPSSLPAVPLNPTALYRMAERAVVPIVVVNRDASVSQGSGFFLWSRTRTTGYGFLVTAEHLVRDADSGYCVLPGGEVRSLGQIAAIDAEADLALLTAPFPWEASLLQSENRPAVGEPVWTFGYPLGLGLTLGEGRVSGGNDDVLQVSAPISPGSSGGPVLDRFGGVAGVVSAANLEGQTINFATPIQRVQELIELDGSNRRSSQIASLRPGEIEARQAQVVMRAEEAIKLLWDGVDKTPVEEAAREARAARERLGGFPGYWLLMSVIEDELGDAEAADTSLEMGLALNSSFVPLLYQRADRLMRRGAYAESRIATDEVLRVDPSNAHGISLSARLHLEDGEIGTAIRLLEISTRIDDTDEEAFMWLGQAHEFNNAPMQAELAYLKALELSENPVLMLPLGRVRLALDRPAAAKEALTVAVKAEPTAESFRLLARASAELADPVAELAATTGALGFEPDAPDLLGRWAVLLGEAGEWESAATVLERLERQRPLTVDERVVRARIALRADRRSEAAKEFAEILEEQPNHVEALAESTRIALFRGYREEALSLLRRLSEVDPNAADRLRGLVPPPINQ